MKIVHCGDSFTHGVGCQDPQNSSYARLVNNYFNSKYINFAKPAASIYIIYLQLIEAIKYKPDLIVINTTSIDRTEWVTESSNYTGGLTANNISYEGFGDTFYLQEFKHYNPIIYSDQIHHINDLAEYRYKAEPKRKLIHLFEYNVLYRDDRIHVDYLNGLLMFGLIQAKQQNVKCLFLLNNTFIRLSPFIDNYIELDFFDISKKMPDSLGTGHCSEEAHRIVADQIIEKVNLLLSN